MTKQQFEIRISARANEIEGTDGFDFNRGYRAGFSDPLVTELVRAAKDVLQKLESGDNFIHTNKISEAIANYEAVGDE